MAQDVYKYNDNLLQYMLDAELYTQELIDEFASYPGLYLDIREGILLVAARKLNLPNNANFKRN